MSPLTSDTWASKSATWTRIGLWLHVRIHSLSQLKCIGESGIADGKMPPSTLVGDMCHFTGFIWSIYCVITWSHNNVHRSVKLRRSHALQLSSYGRSEATIYLLECHVLSWWGCALDTLVVPLYSKKESDTTGFFTVSVKYYISFGGFTIKNVSMRMGITIPGTIYRLLQVLLWTIVTMRIPKIWMML